MYVFTIQFFKLHNAWPLVAVRGLLVHIFAYSYLLLVQWMFAFGNRSNSLAASSLAHVMIYQYLHIFLNRSFDAC